MIIMHENLPPESFEIAKALEKAYGIQAKIISKNLDDIFSPMKEFEGYWHSSINFMDKLAAIREGKVMIITDKDIYMDTNKEDDWVFGYNCENLKVVSTARMKRFDNEPSKKLIVPKELYIKRLSALAIHEVGHDVIHANHFQKATFVNARTGYEAPLGKHCTDNSCIMYEIIGIRAPPKEKEYLRLGEENKYDAGLDDVLERMKDGWFCGKCKPSIEIAKDF